MAMKDITDKDVCAVVHYYPQFGMDAVELLMRISHQPEKVCVKCIERAIDRGLVECGVSSRVPWLTETGKAKMDEAPTTLAGRREQLAFDLITGVIPAGK